MKKLSPAIKGVIFDGRGKWTFDVTDGRRDELLAAERGSESYAGAHGYGSRRDPGFLFDRCYPLIAWNENSSPAGREEKIRRFIVSARNLGVTVTYAPIEP
jgi:hypothetical protein